jgi:hypothetical protein
VFGAWLRGAESAQTSESNAGFQRLGIGFITKGVHPTTPPPLPPRKSSGSQFVILAIIAVAILAALGFGLIALTRAVNERRTAHQALQAFTREAAEAARERLTREDPVGGSAEQIDRFQQKLGDMVDDLPAVDRGTALAAQATLASIQLVMKEYETAYTALVQAGAHGATGLTSIDDIEARRRLVVAFGAANEKLSEALEAMPARFRSELQARRVNSLKIEAEVRAFRKSSQHELVAKVRDFDRQLVTKMLETLDLYQQRQGHWSVGANGELSFEADEDVQRYNAIHNEIDTIAKNQAAAQTQLVEAQARAAK